MSEQKVRSVIIDKLKNGYLISPNKNMVNNYENCVVVEGLDYNRLATEISKMFNETLETGPEKSNESRKG